MEAQLEPCQAYKMALYAKTVNGFEPLEEVKRIKSSKLAVNK